MRCRSLRLFLFISVILLMAVQTPAPLIYRAGEGWTYEPPEGGGNWTRSRAQDQLEVAQQAFEANDYKLAVKAGRRTVRVWPLSDFAPEAQYTVARAYEAQDKDEKAFKEYQKLAERYPTSEKYAEVLQRQFDLANQFLAGQWFKLWGVIPFFPSMDKTVRMYEQIIENGPYSEVAPQAQMSIGTAREKQEDYAAAVKAYERAADRYHDKKAVASDAMWKAGQAYLMQA